MNGKRRNVYVGMALRKPDTPRRKRTSKAAVLGTLALWADLDDARSADELWLNAALCPPTYEITTGVVPHPRAQLDWRLGEPITSIERIEELLGRLCAGLNGDPQVVDAARVMRLAGTIAWPTGKKLGRVPELTTGHPNGAIEHVDPLAIVNHFPPRAARQGQS